MHYNGPVPLDDVIRRLPAFNVEAISTPVTAVYEDADGNEVTLTDSSRQVIVRPDTQHILGVFKDGYVVHQYQEWLIGLASKLLDTSTSDLGIANVVTLKNGAVAAVQFEVRRPKKTCGPPALVLALSATVNTERITAVLGANASIWTVTVAAPHNDLIKSGEQLSELRSLLRFIFDEIKAVFGEAATLHIFPACSVSAAVEFGRVRMPKADMPWQVYDQIQALGGFLPTLAIPNGGYC